MPTPIIELEGLTKSYGATTALGPLNLSIMPGGSGLLGPNGAGKSTLVRLLMGLIRPTSGTVRVLGDEVSEDSTAVRQRIGYVPEGDAFFPRLNGIEAVAYAGRLVGMGRADARQRAHKVLDFVDLGEARYRAVAHYSTGMRQRLKLAQALVHSPELLILDEPTEGVDPAARSEILELIGELAKDHGLGVLLSTHLLNDVETLCRDAIVLSRGHVAAHGAVRDLKKRQGRAFVLRVDGSQEFLPSVLDMHNIGWRPANDGMMIDLEDPLQIFRVIQDAGMVVRHLAPAELTLGEAYVQALTGGEADA